MDYHYQNQKFNYISYSVDKLLCFHSMIHGINQLNFKNILKSRYFIINGILDEKNLGLFN